MRRLILLFLLALTALPAVASAATVTGGASIRLEGLNLKAAGEAKRTGKVVSIPAFSGTIAATSATLTHSGVLQLKGTNLTGVKTVLGPQSKTTAIVDGKRKVLFTYQGVADFQQGRASLTNAKVRLAAPAAKALSTKQRLVGRANVVAEAPAPAADSVVWRPRESLIRYINSETGRTEVSGGAQEGPREVRPGSDAALVYSFAFPEGKGALRFFWQERGIDLTYADPVVSADGTKMSVSYQGNRIDMLNLGAPTDRTYPATLTKEGADTFAGFYTEGAEFGTVTVNPPAARRRGAALATASAARKQKAKPRIVALSPFTANTLAQLGTIPVGVANTLGGRDRFSKKLAGVERLELSHPNGPNLEQLAALDPDIVLSSSTWERGHAAMRDLGIRVVLTDPGSVAGIPAATRRIGALVGRKKQADKIARTQAREAVTASRGISEHPRTLVVLGVGRAPYAFLPASWGGDLITKAGAELLTEDLDGDGGFARISDEEVLRRNPEVIIAVPHGNARDLPSIEEYLRNNPYWKETDAGQNNRIYIAKGNTLLQPFTDVGRMIRDMRTLFLKN